MISNGKQASIAEIFIFILTMSFSPQYLPIDTRIIFYIFWIILSISRSKNNKKIRLTSYCKITGIILLFLSIYSMFVVLISMSNDSYVFMRYIRALAALIVIIIYTSNIRIDKYKLIRACILVLTLHSIIIILEIINPTIKEIFYLFSGTSKKFYKFRASGLVNSYDLAGIYSNLGLLISSLVYIENKKNKYLLSTIICIIATIFTSRINIIVLILVLAFIFIKTSKKNIVFKIFITMFFILIGIGGIGLWSITTDSLPTIREYIFSRSWGGELYTLIRNTYSDDKLVNIVSNHFIIEVNTTQNLLLGTGLEGNFDPGYSKILNSIGIIGLGIILAYYIQQTIYIKRISMILSNNNGYIVKILINFILMVIFLGDFKILYFFSTSIFELLSLLIISYEKIYYENKNYQIKKYIGEDKNESK